MTAAGWYPDGTGTIRWWDGTRWTPHTAPHPTPPVQMAAQMAVPMLPVAVPARQVYVPPPTNHVLHLLLTVFTLGLWLPVWAIIGISEGITRRDAMRRWHEANGTW